MEDDSGLRAKHQTNLAQQAYEVMLSKEASVLDSVCNVQPELVIIGLSKPGCGSLGLCRQNRPCVSGKILFLNPFADDFIQQSISLQVLLAWVRMLLRRQLLLLRS